MLQNAHRVEGDIAYISLTKGQEAMIDVADLPLILPFRWYASYVPHMKGYYARATAPGGERLMMHRLLLQPGEGEWIDHINHNTLDNRRSNIRIVSPAGNAWNRLSHKPNLSTGELGVTVQRLKGGLQYYTANVTRDGIEKRRNFPFTPEGLDEAKALAERWREDISYEPDRTPRERAAKRTPPPILTSTGVRGVSVQKNAYHFRCFSKHCPAYHRFPLTPEGLAAAKAASDAHHNRRY